MENEVSHKKTNIVCFHFYVVLIEDEFRDWSRLVGFGAQGGVVKMKGEGCLGQTFNGDHEKVLELAMVTDA